SVVFGGFAAENLATRIDDARPKLLITTDAGMRGGEVIPYKPLVDKAMDLSGHPPPHVVVYDRGLDAEMPLTEGRDLDYGELREKHAGAEVPVEWLESEEPSYILYTSGTTGTPKGVQRDTGGYAVALAASMEYVFGTAPGETMFTASDVGWVVGHSYTVYAPLIIGGTTVVYEGLPVRPDPGIWWEIVEEHGVTTMFTSPTAIRALQKQDVDYIKRRDLGSLRHMFLAGEPLDAPTSEWVAEALGVPVVDNYWQTESGWPILSSRLPGVGPEEIKVGAAGLPCPGYDTKLLEEDTGAEVGVDEKGILVIEPPLPPGCMTTIWGDDERFVETYFRDFPGRQVYSTFDYATRDEDGYYYILGRSDDVINVAGHRLGTREIEEAVSGHAEVAEVAAIGVKDEYKGQVVVAYVIPKDGDSVASEDGRSALAESVKGIVADRIGAIARPSEVRFVGALPKTRSGKLLRRGIQAIAESRDPGDMSTLEDPAALEDIRSASPG
ncbi:MAG: AMP-binding protein, partial [Rubrobacter sp.]|nr:AMP-binding protein [Rubrobacter sp.]